MTSFDGVPSSISRSFTLPDHESKRPKYLTARRLALAAALGGTIALGLASRRFKTRLPVVIQKEAGDVLWAMAAYWGIALLRPGWRPGCVALLAAGLAILSECSQLSHAGWLEWLRGYHLGGLLLGRQFSWLDLAMYPIGAAAAWGIDWGMLWRARPRGESICRRTG